MSHSEGSNSDSSSFASSSHSEPNSSSSKPDSSGSLGSSSEVLDTCGVLAAGSFKSSVESLIREFEGSQ